MLWLADLKITELETTQLERTHSDIIISTYGSIQILTEADDWEFD